MPEISKAWDWSKSNAQEWNYPSEESYYLLHRWQNRGFQRMLDLGCGRGRHALQFARAGFQVRAMDLSEPVVKALAQQAAKAHLPIQATTGDMLQLPYEDRQFDCLLAYHVISHTDSKGIQRILEEIRRVLKTGGEFFLTFVSKNGGGYQRSHYPRIDAHTLLKTDEGPEKNIPHFYADERLIHELFANDHLITVRQVQEVPVKAGDRDSWHYMVLGCI